MARKGSARTSHLVVLLIVSDGEQPGESASPVAQLSSYLTENNQAIYCVAFSQVTVSVLVKRPPDVDLPREMSCRRI